MKRILLSVFFSLFCLQGIAMQGDQGEARNIVIRGMAPQLNSVTLNDNRNIQMDLFPSLSFKYNAKENLILRAAFTTALARPNYYDLVPFANISAEDQEIAVGNPNLNPPTPTTST